MELIATIMAECRNHKFHRGPKSKPDLNAPGPAPFEDPREEITVPGVALDVEFPSLSLVRSRWLVSARRLSPIFMLAALVALPGTVQALTRPATTDPSNPVNDAVVGVGAFGGGIGCTGVLVAPRLVLTAGHCLQAAIFSGETGMWDSSAPVFRQYLVNTPSAQSGWSASLKGSTAILDNMQFPRAQLLSATTASTTSDCRARCDANGRCGGWDYQGAMRQCELMQQRAIVFFGNGTGPLRTVVSSRYSAAGVADILMLELDESIPPTVAKPAPVMSFLYPTQTEIAGFLQQQNYLAVGFSPTHSTRQQIGMSLAAYPLNGTDLAMLKVAGAGGAAVEEGDSGSPLFLLRRQPDGSVKRFVAGICQGIEGGGGRYTLTGINLARAGQLLQFPYNPTTVDRHVAAPIGEWLNNILYQDFKSRNSVLPLFSWWSEQRHDNFLSSDPRWAPDPRGAVPDESGMYLWPKRTRDGIYQITRLEGFVFDPRRPAPAGAVPLWSWFSSARSENMTTANPHWSISPSTVVWDGENINGPVQEGYKLFRLEGYIYDPARPQPPNTKPLYGWFSPSRGDNFSTTDPHWSGAGITPGATRESYNFVRLEGFVPQNFVE